MRLFWIALLIFLNLTSPVWACRQALVLALDVSGSVDAKEYQQQVTGLALALSHPDIRDVILADLDNPVTIMVFEWSSQNHQYVILPWSRLDSERSLDEAIAQIRRHKKVRAGLKTALGTALAFGQSMLERQPECWRHTIDVSGDGRNNVGPLPQTVYRSGFQRTTVNALVVGKPETGGDEGPGITSDDLLKYFENEVIRGPGAFAMKADGYADYARAMQKKLARELRLPIFGQAPAAPTIKDEAPG
ncbi:MAG: DUF1194 domain-containing protein [Litoreibacter sp.]|nr:DUF1194 domain-containing protein [Litoreibacter sp.]